MRHHRDDVHLHRFKEGTTMMAMVKQIMQHECKHDDRFLFSPNAQGHTDAGWVCSHYCGYFLPFDPATFPDGIKVLTSPNPKFTKKTLPLAPFPNNGKSG